MQLKTIAQSYPLSSHHPDESEFVSRFFGQPPSGQDIPEDTQLQEYSSPFPVENKILTYSGKTESKFMTWFRETKNSGQPGIPVTAYPLIPSLYAKWLAEQQRDNILNSLQAMVPVKRIVKTLLLDAGAAKQFSEPRLGTIQSELTEQVNSLKLQVDTERRIQESRNEQEKIKDTILHTLTTPQKEPVFTDEGALTATGQAYLNSADRKTILEFRKQVSAYSGKDNTATLQESVIRILDTCLKAAEDREEKDKEKNALTALEQWIEHPDIQSLTKPFLDGVTALLTQKNDSDLNKDVLYTLMKLVGPNPGGLSTSVRREIIAVAASICRMEKNSATTDEWNNEDVTNFLRWVSRQSSDSNRRKSDTAQTIKTFFKPVLEKIKKDEELRRAGETAAQQRSSQIKAFLLIMLILAAAAAGFYWMIWLPATEPQKYTLEVRDMFHYHGELLRKEDFSDPADLPEILQSSIFHNYGIMHGKGDITYSSGNSYSGEWKLGEQHGYGVMRYADGSVYEGNWKNGETEGYGILTEASGKRFEGQWRNGKLDGEAKIESPEGIRFEGTLKEGELFYGKVTYPEGVAYEGPFKGIRPHGKGTITARDTQTGREVQLVAEFDHGLYEGRDLIQEMREKKMEILFFR